MFGHVWSKSLKKHILGFLCFWNHESLAREFRPRAGAGIWRGNLALEFLVYRKLMLWIFGLQEVNVNWAREIGVGKWITNSQNYGCPLRDVITKWFHHGKNNDFECFWANPVGEYFGWLQPAASQTAQQASQTAAQPSQPHHCCNRLIIHSKNLCVWKVAHNSS